MPVMQMVHDKDPKEVIFDQYKPYLDDLRPLYSLVVVAIYQRPEMTRGGIILTQQTREEDVYQGKVGLVIKLGTRAFEDTDKVAFKDTERAKVGDWVVFRASDGFPMDVGSKDNHTRWLNDVNIKAIIKDPDQIW